jgi:hypothetical protein
MIIPEDPTEGKKWMMDVLRGHGEEFLIFEPEDRSRLGAILASLLTSQYDPKAPDSAQTCMICSRISWLSRFWSF